MTAEKLEDAVHATTNTAGVADLYQVTQRAVQHWVKEGMPTLKRGRFRLSDVVRWRELKLTERAASDISEERKMLVAAQRQRTELENAKARSEVFDAGLVGDAIQEMAAIFASQLDSLAPRLAVKLSTLDDASVIQTVLLDECRHIRTACSAAVSAFGADLIGSEDSRPAAKKKRRSVGGRKPRAAAGKSRARPVAD